MKSINNLFRKNPYPNLNKKNGYLQKRINFLTRFHFKHSNSYKKILTFTNYRSKSFKIENLPFIPVNLFKVHQLKSVEEKKIIKVMTSSGTTGAGTSKIYLDKNNASNQRKALAMIMKSILGEKRLPMLIIDKKPKLSNRNEFNARITAINGFSIFGTNHTFLLGDDGKVNQKELEKFIKKFSKKDFFIFGFTSFVYENLIKNNIKNISNINFKNGILLHGGGWKKMEKLKINNDKFKDILKKKYNLLKVYNYYGLVEQTGSIFLECNECNYFRTSIFSEVLVRKKILIWQKKMKKGFYNCSQFYPQVILATTF